MMESFSPLSRRLIALALAVLLLVSLLSAVILPFAGLTYDTLQRLAEVRSAVARMEMFRAMPAPADITAFPRGMAIQAMDRKAAHDRLASYLAGQTAIYGLRSAISHASGDATESPGVISLDIRMTGPRDPMLKFIGALEAGAPQIRLMQYRLTAMQAMPGPMAMAPSAPAPGEAGRQLFLEARASALWAGGQ